MKHLAAAIALMVLSLAHEAHANLITYDFTAIENVVSGDPLALPTGQAFTGSFTLDTSAPGVPGGTAGTYFFDEALQTVVLGGIVLDVSGWEVDNVILANNAYDSAINQYLNGYTMIAGNYPTGEGLTIGLSIYGGPPLGTSDLSSPLPPITYYNGAADIEFYDPNGAIDDHITNIWPAPEPSSLALFSPALLALFLGRSATRSQRGHPTGTAGRAS